MPEHREQLSSNACVTACAEMVLRARGQEVDQLELHERLPGSARGRSLRAVAPVVDGEFVQLDPVSPSLMATLRGYVTTGRWVVAQVFCAAVARWAHERGVERGRHGPLPQHPGPLHAVLLCQWDAEQRRFLVLDPWFRGTDQPWRVTDVELIDALQGDVVLVAAA